MADKTFQRRLAAILAADVVGYSRLMQADEVGTLEALKAHRRALVLADDEVTFPAPRLATVSGSEWPLMDQQHRLGEPRTTPAWPLVRAAMSPAGAQRSPVWRPNLRWPDQARVRLIHSLIDAFVA